MTFVNHYEQRIKSWTRGVQFADNAFNQAANIAALPFIHKHVAIMPDVHLGNGATIGSVIATNKAIIPAAVGVDLGCGMMAVKTSLMASDLPDNLFTLRTLIEAAVPHGRTNNGGQGDRGAWQDPAEDVVAGWKGLGEQFSNICEKYPTIAKSNSIHHLGTLGGGNHFIEVCIDLDQCVWVMLHSGSRGVGNKIGTTFIQKARKDMERYFINLPDKDLAYIPEGCEYFNDYTQAVDWAQRFAKASRVIMMKRTLLALRDHVKSFEIQNEAINCHHNYISNEHHFGKRVWVTRKGAVSARVDELGIIPGSMGAKSFIVRGLGNRDSFHSCSHGAGRVMSRTQARKELSLDQHIKDTEGVECRKDKEVIDESPKCYKSIEAVMAAQEDLVEVVATLKQVLCIKG